MSPSDLPEEQPQPVPGLHAVTDERRESVREPSSSSLRLTLDTDTLEGQAENISGVGVLFYSAGNLRVSVEIDEDGHRRTRRGRLVRVQRMSLDSTGFAVEFDPE